jgi:hypothetical protein
MKKKRLPPNTSPQPFSNIRLLDLNQKTLQIPIPLTIGFYAHRYRI